MTQNDEQLDAIVIGGGPAGATAATVIAQRGGRVRVYERDRFPRFHIGESLIPETYWTLRRINMLEKLKRSRFVVKHSVQFIGTTGKLSAPFYFQDNNPHECSLTWQVVRSEFDKMMLDNAREHGAEVFEEARVLDVLFDGARAVGIKLQTAEGPRDVFAKVVVDASGQSGLIMNKLKLRVWDPTLNKGAIWTYFEGAVRGTGRDEGATLVIQTPSKQGWFWFIPLHGNRVSLGVVGPFDHLFKNRGSHEQVFLDEVANCPAVGERIANATRVTGYFATRDFSYRCTQMAGDGWVVIGDAFGFLDPLYSSGLFLALQSGEWAADALCDGLAQNDTSAAQLGHFAPKLHAGIDRMRRLVCEFYDGFNFGHFVRSFPDLKGRITDLLIGDLFSEKVDQVWQPMESLYAPGKQPPSMWNSGTPSDIAAVKSNELVLPDGAKP